MTITGLFSLLMSHRLTRMAALAGTGLVLGSLLWQSEESREPSDALALRGPSEPDGFVVDGRYRSFDINGQLETVIYSPRIEQFEARNLATMSQPDATLHDPDSDTTWRMTANRGEFQEDKDIIDLEGDVLVRRPLANGEVATLEAEHLTLDNKQRTVYTDTPVVLTEAHGVTRATGMKAWINDRVLELHSQVKGRYDTPQSN
ncbi:LPS export ABC transporter periplasmic protein LptC [Marinobacter changyiensis]|uniref:LPS export ABC transporter periplasmic protein LptC n=1 Tax=Marinobacter changyiensis TaxID=2604091 RepID=UPI0015D16176|nr:LPS export ABC transporter periplasmic protein LptC [Marinobacter changyiensis]